MAKTDWTMQNTVFPPDMNQIGQEINANTEQLSAAPATPVTIPQGVSIVNADRKSRFKDMRIVGRTLVNLMGRDGNFSVINNWRSVSGLDIAIDSSSFTSGASGCKLTIGVGQTSGTMYYSPKVMEQGKYYIAVADLKNGNATKIEIALYNGGPTVIGTAVTSTSSFQTAFAKLSPANNLSNIEFKVTGTTAGQYAYVDSVRLYKITQAEYDAIDTMTPEQVAAKYPYFDDMKHVNAIYVQNSGKNLLPSFSEWMLHTNAVVTEPYKLTLNATAAGQRSGYSFVPVAGQFYTLSFGNISANSNVYAEFIDPNGNLLAAPSLNANPAIFLPLPNTVKVMIWVDSSASGTFTFANPMLNIGDTALPFEPQKPSYMYLPDCNLRSNVDGSIADQLYMDGEGKPRAIRRFKEMALDGSLGWVYSPITISGSKRVEFAQSTGHTPSYQQVIKFDGKVLPRNNNVDTADTTLVSTTTVYIVVPNSDSGWGDAYTPSADEIKAYFNGWKISSNNTASPAPYTGTGNRYWYAVGSTPLDSTWYTAANDINWAVNNPVSSVSRYKLLYQLAQSVDEPVNYEGELMLHDGPNQIEMGTGVVVREAANPKPILAGEYVLNDVDPTLTATRLKNRTRIITQIYREGKQDSSWKITSDISAYGIQRAYISPSVYDPTAAYSVTYRALDTYMLGIAPQSISGTYTPNIKETVDDTVQVITGLRRDVSVLQNTKAQKQQPQMIAATLINGATGYGSGYDTAMYFKDDAGKVGFVGLINNVAANSIVLYLPESYRPSNRIILDAIGDNGSNNFVVVRVTIGAEGSVLITNPGTTWTSLSSIPMFRAEQ